jgi:hypothetical protein
VEEEVGGEEGNSKIDDSCKCNSKDKGNLLYSIQKKGDGQSGTPLVLAGPTSPFNSGNNVIKGKVGRGGDGLTGTALVSAGPKSQSNGGNNDVKGKVRGGGEGVEEEVGGEEGNSKIDESCKCNNKDNIDLLYSIH